MSLLSKLTGINIHLGKVDAVDAAAKVLTVIHSTGGENSSLITKLVEIGEEVIAHPPTSPVAAVTTTGHIIAILDPNAEAQANAKLEAFVRQIGARFKLSDADIAVVIADAEPMLDQALEALGIPHVS